jgi:hypothetical protein
MIGAGNGFDVLLTDSSNIAKRCRNQDVGVK